MSFQMVRTIATALKLKGIYVVRIINKSNNCLKVKPWHVCDAAPMQISMPSRNLCSSVQQGNEEIDSNDDEAIEIDYSSLETDPEKTKLIKTILIEHSVAKEMGERVPSSIAPKDMEDLLTKSYSSRKRYMNYLLSIEVAEKALKVKKQLRAKQRAAELAEREKTEGKHIRYGLHNNTIFSMVRKDSMNRFYTSRLVSSVQLSAQPIVFDMSFDGGMTPPEKTATAKQLKECYATNKYHPDPFDLYFVNSDLSCSLMEKLLGHIPNLNEPSSMLNVVGESYLDLFPRDKLVYLTPDAPNMLEHFDHDAVYIIGSVVDKSPKGPITMAKAKKEGLKMARLPLEKYIFWGLGGKAFPLNQVISILLDIRYEKDWAKVLKKHLPSRKFAKEEEVMQRAKSYDTQLKRKMSKLEKKGFYRDRAETRPFFEKSNTYDNNRDQNQFRPLILDRRQQNRNFNASESNRYQGFNDDKQFFKKHQAPNPFENQNYNNRRREMNNRSERNSTSSKLSLSDILSRK